MNLRHHKAMLAGAHAILALIGVVLLGAGLALLSGLLEGGAPSAATALVMVRPVPDAPPHEPESPPVPHPQPPEPARKPVRFVPPAPEPPRHEGRPQRQPHGSAGGARLAVVIDDFGHAVDVVQHFLRLDYPLTYSVLPDVPHTEESGRLIHAAGREQIVHLPMEPLDYPVHDPGPHPLLLRQGLEETAERLRAYLERLPDAVGASNHMGSAYTYDDAHMEVVQTVLAEHHLFFLNSRTGAGRAPSEVARRWGYAYLERDVFLDHDPAPAAIERAWQQVVRDAKRHGHAVAIGHPYPQTWRMLHRNLPRLAAAGVTLVPLSQLLQR